MLTIANLTMRFAGQVLFEDVNAKFEAGRHYGLYWGKWQRQIHHDENTIRPIGTELW